MTTTESRDAITAEATSVERFLRALEYSGNPALAEVSRAVKATFETRAEARPPCTMKFSLTQDALLKVLTLVMKTTNPRSTLEVLGHFLMVTRPSALENVPTQIIFTGTNLETGISIQVEAEVEREGAYTVPAKALLDCVKTFPKGRPVTIEVQAPFVLVSCEKRKFKLRGGLDASEFPLLWQEMVLGEGAPYLIESETLRRAIKEVGFAAAADESRPVLTTVCMSVQEELVELVTADAFRIAKVSIPLPKKIEGREATILVPVSSMRLLAEVMPADIPVIVAWDKSRARAVFQAGQVQLLTRLVEGTYPDYAAIIPKAHKTALTLERKQLEQVLQAFKPFAKDSENILKMSFTVWGAVAFHAESEGLGEADDELEADVDGEDGQIIFNLQLLADVLKFVPAETFTFYLSGPDKPGLILPAGRKDFGYTLMPMSTKR